MTNWFGYESHPSDDLIHWSQIRFGGDGSKLEKECAKRVKAIRKAWDIIHASPETTKAFKLLRDAHYDKVRSDEAETEAGEDL